MIQLLGLHEEQNAPSVLVSCHQAYVVGMPSQAKDETWSEIALPILSVSRQLRAVTGFAIMSRRPALRTPS